MKSLWHYTDDTGYERIVADGFLRPLGEMIEPKIVAEFFQSWQLQLLDLVWLTDLDHPMRDALGLTNHYTDGDYTKHRFHVSPNRPRILWWPVARRSLNEMLVQSLETTPGAQPMHWYVSEYRVPVAYDPIGVTGGKNR